MASSIASPLWTPSPDQVARSNLTRFIREAVQPLGGAAAAVCDSAGLYAWSVGAPAEFWPAVWRFCG
ncbi:MAG: hypothetical protein HOQ19_06515, partial [Gemmatimonadaceae bacterium]|nr:hypothetical protein [Gemmatimonadaceae bacterium]